MKDDCGANAPGGGGFQSGNKCGGSGDKSAVVKDAEKRVSANDHTKLLNAVTEYDRKQLGKKSYNPYALGHYAAALQNVRDDMESGKTLRQALLKNFNGRLLSVVLKSVGEKDFTKDEHR